jgi:hypothetical protein
MTLASEAWERRRHHSPSRCKALRPPISADSRSIALGSAAEATMMSRANNNNTGSHWVADGPSEDIRGVHSHSFAMVVEFFSNAILVTVMPFAKYDPATDAAAIWQGQHGRRDEVGHTTRHVSIAYIARSTVVARARPPQQWRTEVRSQTQTGRFDLTHRFESGCFGE